MRNTIAALTIGAALAATIDNTVVIADENTAPPKGSKPSGSKPVPGGGAKERARRLSRMEKDRMLNPPGEIVPEGTGNAWAAPAMTGSLPVAGAPTLQTESEKTNEP